MKHWGWIGILFVLLVLTACSDRECDLCHAAGADNEFQATSVWVLCDDCYDRLTGNAVTADKEGACSRCGVTIDAGRTLCKTCLGFGICRDCGKDIADDRLYCNECLEE